MKVNGYGYKWLFAIVCCFLIQESYAQVTIGTMEPPVAGALLQIKNIDNSGANPNANKGMSMPRVNLTDMGKLSPMYSYADVPNTPVQSDLDAHKGLAVYNTNQCLARKGEESGMYVWMGDTWAALGETPLAGTVDIFRDPRDGEEYKIGDFGTAGVWMLQNMRAKSYSQSPGNPPVLRNSANVALRSYLYPSATANSNGLDSTLYYQDKSIGLLYNYAAATNLENNVAIDQGGDYPSHPVVQGICPAGWHIPSDKEWTDLENYMIANTSQYSTLPNIGGTPLAYTSTGTRGTSHGTAMRASCNPVGIATATGTGASLPVTKGGFYVYLVGYSFGGNAGTESYGVLSYFWSSSSGPTAAIEWARNVTTGGGVWRNTIGRSNFQAVRCKLNTP